MDWKASLLGHGKACSDVTGVCPGSCGQGNINIGLILHKNPHHKAAWCVPYMQEAQDGSGRPRQQTGLW